MSSYDEEIDQFHFDSLDQVEDMRRYRPGGYHPIKLGDMLASSTSRYRILHKLGHGSFATVWLARDIRPEGRFVAIKILVAELTGVTQEVATLSLLSQHSESRSAVEQGWRHVVQLLDHFQVQGPNGTHDVIVTDVLSPLTSIVRHPKFQRVKGSFCRQALEGVAYLQSRGIAHGDLHTGNLACTLPGLDDQSEDDLLSHFGSPEVTIVLPRNTEKQSDSLPPYLVPSVSILSFMMEEVPAFADSTPELRIIDFGSACRVGEERSRSQCAIGVRAPEIAFPQVALKVMDPDWDARSDIWSLACTIYEIASGGALFYGVGLASGLLKRMAKVAGHLPESWESYWRSSTDLQEQEVSEKAADEEWVTRRPYLQAACSDGEDVDQLVDLLRKMLQLDPNKRPSASELLHHPWFKKNEKLDYASVQVGKVELAKEATSAAPAA